MSLGAARLGCCAAGRTGMNFVLPGVGSGTPWPIASSHSCGWLRQSFERISSKRPPVRSTGSGGAAIGSVRFLAICCALLEAIGGLGCALREMDGVCTSVRVSTDGVEDLDGGLPPGVGRGDAPRAAAGADGLDGVPVLAVAGGVRPLPGAALLRMASVKTGRFSQVRPFSVLFSGRCYMYTYSK